MKITILIICAVSLLVGCGQNYTSNPSRYSVIADAFTNVANSYFELGVNAGQNVNLANRAKWEPESFGQQLVNEAIVVAGTNIGYLRQVKP